jgi:pyridoxal phosphate enzyme (YggS family)
MSGELTPELLTERLRQVQASLPDGVTLIAVTKTVPVEVMRWAYAAGLRHFGENRVQEAEQKQAALADLPDLTWHLLGHLQSNKARKAIARFDWIHSLDSLDLAQRLEVLAAEMGRSPHLFLQVKLRPDPSKSGWEVANLEQALPALDQLRHLQICGLMSIPPLGLSPAEISQYFAETRDLANRIRQQPWQHLHVEHLSMGMSNDYPLAVAMGASFIRLGTVLFGKRRYS